MVIFYVSPALALITVTVRILFASIVNFTSKASPGFKPLCNIISCSTSFSEAISLSPSSMINDLSFGVIVIVFDAEHGIVLLALINTSMVSVYLVLEKMLAKKPYGISCD